MQSLSPPEYGIENAEKPSLDAIEDVAGANYTMLDTETNKRILRKIDYKLMPVVRESCSRKPSFDGLIVALAQPALHHLRSAVL